MKKLIFALFALVLSVGANAQIDMLSSTSGTLDSVTNTEVSTLTARNAGIKTQTSPKSTVFVIKVTKISGTVGGTISLQGSLDGTNFSSLNTVETQTALATITASDASAVYNWRVDGNPFTYYRVRWAGTGTMVASFSAKMFSR